jgi:DNA-binding XRE family transcriptional regulator
MKKISAAMTDEVIAEQLFARIEARRKALQITQADMAARIDITPKTYRNLKKGSCSVMVLLTLLRQLNLLENLDSLIPQPTVRPTDVWRQTQSSAAGIREPSAGVGERLAARQRLKTRDQ